MGDLPKAMNYDYQLVLALVPGGKDKDEGNRVVCDNVENLVTKRNIAGDGAKTRVVYLTGQYGADQWPDLISEKAHLRGPRLRVYIVGHGDGESSGISHLNATALAEMLETLNTPITVLGLVACNAGLEDLGQKPNGRPAHSLAKSLYLLVKNFVTEIHAYSGEVRVNRTGTSFFREPGEGTVPWRHPTLGLIHVSKMQVKKVVTQQKLGDQTVPRKMVVNANGATWVKDD